MTVGKIGGKEIDFVCDKRGEKLYVQVAYLLASEETIAREFGAYIPFAITPEVCCFARRV